MLKRMGVRHWSNRRCDQRSVPHARQPWARSLLIVCVLTVGALPIKTTPARAADCDAVSVRKETFTTSDGVNIAAFTQGKGDTAVVLVHQVNDGHCGWAAEAAALAKTMRVISIDLRGYGASDRPRGANALSYPLDIAAAVQFERDNGAVHIVLMGASMGASAVVVAASRISPPVDAAISVSAPTNYRGQNARAAAPKLVVPIRYVAANDDGGAASAAKTLNRASVASPDHEALIFSAGGHGWRLVRPGSEAERKLLDFIGATIKQ
jgi:pimeloyl-ACP methyl ester carboxylesterase